MFFSEVANVVYLLYAILLDFYVQQEIKRVLCQCSHPISGIIQCTQTLLLLL